MEASGSWRLGRRPGLDGLRGVAILLVVACHGGFAPTETGAVGVAVFFVLSGFLITRVVVEAEGDGRWSFSRFVANRAVRLAPALIVCVAVCSALWVASGKPPTQVATYALLAVLYLGDLFYSHTIATAFGHTWSLAVEEQFYLLWPLVAVLFVRRARFVWWVLGGAGVSMALRFALWPHDRLAAFAGPETNAYALLLGCTLALSAGRLPTLPNWAEPVGLGCLLAVVLALPVLPVAMLTGPVIAAAVTVCLVWTATTSPRLLTASWLRFVGRVSYAWYLWHRPLMFLMGEDAKGVGSLPGIALSFLIAVASTLLLEEPVRRWWRSHRSGVGGDAGAGESGAVEGDTSDRARQEAAAVAAAGDVDGLRRAGREGRP